MNPFMLIAALLMLGASAWSFWYGWPSWKLGALYLCYATANALLAFMKD